MNEHSRGWNRAAAAVLAACALLTSGAAGPAMGKTLAELYEAAKSEGTVSMIGPPSAELRQELSTAFGAAFPGITLEYSGMQGNAAAAKLRSEGRAKLHTVDVIINGPATGSVLLKGADILAPFESMLVVPESADQSKWQGGQFTWGDKDRMVLLMLAQSYPQAVINTDLVKPGEVASDKDLLDPKWKGKIVSGNPLSPGPARLVYRRAYDLFGEAYIRDLAKQDITVLGDLRQAVDFLAKGRYSIALGASTTQIHALTQRGVKNLKVLGERDWKDPLTISPGFGCLMVPKDRPHPKAAQLFVNWVLTKDGLLAVSKGIGAPSLRNDVPTDHVPESIRVREGVTYTEAYSEAYLTNENEGKLRQLITELGFVK